MKRFHPRCRQAGVTLLEMAVVVLVAGLLAVAAARGIDHAARLHQASNLALQASIGYDVLQDYVAKNLDALMTGAGVPGVADPLAPTKAELEKQGYPNFSLTSTVLNAQWRYQIRTLPAACGPGQCTFWVLFWLDQPPLSPDRQPDMALVAQAALRSQRPAGFSPLDNPKNLQGVGGTFTVANPVPGEPAGILAVYGQVGGPAGQYVRMGESRAVTLQGPLRVGGTLMADADLQVAGGATRLTQRPNEGGVMSLKGADGSLMHQQVLQGRTRWLDGAGTRELASIDASGTGRFAGGLQAQGEVSAGGTLRAQGGRVAIRPGAAVGTGCVDGPGTYAADAAGRLLSCVAGLWRGVGPSAFLCFSYYQHFKSEAYVEGPRLFFSPVDRTGSQIPAPNNWYMFDTRCTPVT